MEPGVELPVLIGQTGQLDGHRWLVDGSLIIGREADCAIVVADRQVSRYHARLTATADGVLLEDLGSKNGTYVNSKQIDGNLILQDGDVLQIALVQSFVFLSSDSTLPLGIGIPSPREQHGRLYLESRSRRVWIGQKEVLPPLSVPQFSLLQALYEQQGKVVSRQELVTAVWGDQEVVGISDQALDALVRRLRDRLVTMDPSHTYLVTARGFGLRLDNPLD